MIDKQNLTHEIQARIELLPTEDQLYMPQLIIGGVRKRYFVDHEKADREMEEMANDPGMQRVLRNEDLPVCLLEE